MRRLAPVVAVGLLLVALGCGVPEDDAPQELSAEQVPFGLLDTPTSTTGPIQVIPPERQGRVFGFAQSIEQAASPITAFVIGPIAQFIFIPFMTTGAGVDLLGGWFGTGTDRGLALLFTVAGMVGLAATLLAMRSHSYKTLSEMYQKQDLETSPIVGTTAVEM